MYQDSANGLQLCPITVQKLECVSFSMILFTKES